MKILFKTFLFLFVSLTAFSCKAQLVQTVDDVKKLEVNKDRFIGKPLSSLFKEIKPEIKRVRFVPGPQGGLGTLYLSFLPDSSFRKSSEKNGKSPVEIRMRVDQHGINWDPSTRPQGHRFDFTKEDEETFGKMTLVQIKINNAD
ncbi:hypothetical protein [Parafilimonas sp.]|uniref:hypothetical protein n=1 Tax=Parafilimonas sp. TaxID=1969739 RepID=UPI003F80F30E